MFSGKYTDRKKCRETFEQQKPFWSARKCSLSKGVSYLEIDSKWSVFMYLRLFFLVLTHCINVL